MRDLVIITLYKEWNDSYKIIGKERENVKFMSVLACENKFPNKIDVIKDNLRAFYFYLRKFVFFKDKLVLCHGGHWGLLMCLRIFPFFGGDNFHVFLYNFYIHSLGNNLIIRKILCFLLSVPQKCTLIVQSAFEVEYYKCLKPELDVRIVGYCSDISEYKDAVLKDYIFTGGYTNRGYQLMINLALEIPKQKFVFVASRLNSELQVAKIPDNVKVYYDVDTTVFEKFLAEAKLVIIPLKENVGASGQMLCLQAMRNRKVIIYANVSSINYYFEKNAGIPYELGSLDSLVKKVIYALKNMDLLQPMGEKAYDNSLSYTIRNRNELLLKIIDSK